MANDKGCSGGEEQALRLHLLKNPIQRTPVLVMPPACSAPVQEALKVNADVSQNQKITTQKEDSNSSVFMKTSLFTIFLTIAFLIPPIYAVDESLFPIELSYDTGIEHIYRFQPKGRYTVKFEANEARGFAGGSDSGFYIFKPAKDGGTIVLQDGSKIVFRLPKIPTAGKSVQASGMVYDPSNKARFTKDITITIKKL
jgi:hypothetical protein